MHNDMRKRRRQVAWICFEPYLDEHQLIKAVQILESGFQFDSVSNLIAYISKTCSEFDIDTATRKFLYGQFHELMAQEVSLPIDPLSLINELEPTKPIVKPPEKSPLPTPLAFAPTETEPPKPAVVEQQPIPPSTLSPETIAFSCFMQQIIDHLPEQVEFFEILQGLSKNKKQGIKTTELPIHSWMTNPKDFNWAKDLNEKKLADIVHLVYTALCELLGPVAADESFHKAMAMCEQRPETRQFPVSRFL